MKMEKERRNMWNKVASSMAKNLLFTVVLLMIRLWFLLEEDDRKRRCLDE